MAEFLKAKDIEHEIRSRGFEKGVVYILQVLAEQHRAQGGHLREIAIYFDKMVDMVGGMTEALHQSKNALDKLSSKYEREDDLDPNTIAAIREEPKN